MPPCIGCGIILILIHQLLFLSGKIYSRPPPTPFRVDVFSKFSSNFFKQCIMEHFGDSDSSRREKLAEIMASVLRTSSNTLIGSAVDASYTLKAVFKQHVRIQQQK